jgi:hypothetical protein
MTLADLLPAFDRECAMIAGAMLKTAYAAAPAKPSYAKKVDAHHSSERKDWDSFQKDMKSKKFRMAVVGVVPSRSSSRLYKIKRIGADRLACGCKDWHYKKSHEGGDCEHIKELAQGLKEKTSSVIGGLARGVAVARTAEKVKKQQVKGKTMKENVVRR